MGGLPQNVRPTGSKGIETHVIGLPEVKRGGLGSETSKVEKTINKEIRENSDN